MVCTDGIADFRFLLVLFGEFQSEDGVRKFRLILRNLSDIVEQTGVSP